MASDAICGVYVIRNIINGLTYYGSSVDIHQRWRRHILYLRRGTHHCSILQKSWDKHGEDAFSFGKVQFVKDASQLLAAEQRWIDIGKHLNILANTAPIAGNSVGIKRPAAVRAAQSARMKGTCTWSAESTEAARTKIRAMVAAGTHPFQREKTPEHKANAAKGQIEARGARAAARRNSSPSPELIAKTKEIARERNRKIALAKHFARLAAMTDPLQQDIAA